MGLKERYAVTPYAMSFLYVASSSAVDVRADLARCAPLAASVSAKLMTEAKLTPEKVCKGMLCASVAQAIAHGVTEEQFLAYTKKMYRIMRASQSDDRSEVDRVMASFKEQEALVEAAVPPAVDFGD